MNLIVMKAGYPSIVIKNETREDYYKALAEADNDNLSHLFKLCHDEMENSLKMILELIDR